MPAEHLLCAEHCRGHITVYSRRLATPQGGKDAASRFSHFTEGESDSHRGKVISSWSHSWSWRLNSDLTLKTPSPLQTSMAPPSSGPISRPARIMSTPPGLESLTS